MTSLLQRYLLVWLSLLSLVAYYWPVWFPDRIDPFLGSRPAWPYLFAATMFSIGCLLPRDEIRQVLQRWSAVVGGTAIQYTAMPVLAYGIGRVANLPQELMLGVILVGCVPGAMASNVLTLAARGNVSYSVSLTTSATLFSPVVVPAVLYLTLRQTDVDSAVLAQKAFWIVLVQVVGPVVAGHLLSRSSVRVERTMRVAGPVVANLTILWIIAGVVNTNRAYLPQARGALLGVLLTVNLLGFASGLAGSFLLRLPDGMRRALTLEVGMQNAGLGTVLAGQLFADQAIIALPSALYTFGCMLTGTILAQIWYLRAPDTAD